MMSTTTLVDRAERTTSDLGESARAHLEQAEQYARRAGESAQIAAEHYAARASQSAHQAAERVGPTVEGLRDDVETMLDDPDTRALVIRTAAGVTVVGVAVWLWRRRKRRQEEDAYEASAEGVPGWTEPKTELAGTSSN